MYIDISENIELKVRKILTKKMGNRNFNMPPYIRQIKLGIRGQASKNMGIIQAGIQAVGYYEDNYTDVQYNLVYKIRYEEIRDVKQNIKIVVATVNDVR